jgi:tetratricopeptide (TPR) repeat protein
MPTSRLSRLRRLVNRVPEQQFFDLLRRSFLGRCFGSAAVFLTPASFVGTSATVADFHLHPRYREQTSFDAALLQIRPGRDEFVTERYHDPIARILEDWSTSLLKSPGDSHVFERVLSQQFRGSAWKAVEIRQQRPIASGLETHKILFSPELALTSSAFLDELRAYFSGISRLLTAEFQITAMKFDSSSITTQVRYELVGTGTGFYREQRIGTWRIAWQTRADDTYEVIAWQMQEEARSRASEPFFTDITRKAFVACASYHSQMLHGADYWRTILDGACGIDIYGHNGVSVGDLHGDGFDDVYICQAAGLPNRLYRNRGNGTFEDVTESSGVGILENTACALIADFDNDGRQDLVVVRANGPLLFLNAGHGKFRLKRDAFQFANPPQGTFTGAGAADYNRDGWLDIYFCLYVYYQGADQYRYPTPYFAAENGPPNFLMHNNGNGTFRDVTAATGLDKNNTRYSFCCGWGDYDNDGWPDLYVVNDFGRKNLYRNNRDGTFSDVAPETGVEDVGAGMSVCWFDSDNDGLEDLYVANMWTAAGERITKDDGFQRNASKETLSLYRKHAMGNSLFRGGNSRFRDDTAKSGTGMGRWSWSSDAWDFDHDGFSDIYIANGMISGPIHRDLNSFFWRQVVANSPNTAKAQEEYEQGWKAINELIRSDYSWSGFERNVLYANNRDGTFSDVSGTLGMDFIEDGRAFALADFDGDGRQEVLIKNRDAPQLRLMKNTFSTLPPAISFRLRGTKSNRDAIGAAVTIKTSVGRQTKRLQAGSGFLSQHSKDLFFGLGDERGSISASVRWPSGLIQEIKDLPANHRISITEGMESPKIEAFAEPKLESNPSEDLPGEVLPSNSETWLLVPVAAPSLTISGPTGKPRLLRFRPGTSAEPADSAVIEIDTDAQQNQDFCAIYNLLFRNIFDRHHDMPLPTSFLLDENGQVVKIYRGQVATARIEQDLKTIPRNDAARLEKSLPFAGVSSMFEFGRNYLSLGSIFFQRGYLDSAGDFFQAAIKDDPASAEACYGLGSVYLKQQKNSQAKQCFEQAANLKASYPETTSNAWNNLGLLSTREGDASSAVGYFEQALKLNPGHFVALENLGNAYRQQKRWEEARGSLERALAIKPQDPEANYSLGMVFAQIGDNTQAYEYLQKAVELRPGYPEALNNLGVLCLRTHRRDEAVAAFEKCIQVAPGFDQSYMNLARVYAIEGASAKARSVLQSLLSQHPDHADARQALDRLH